MDEYDRRLIAVAMDLMRVDLKFDYLFDAFLAAPREKLNREEVVRLLEAITDADTVVPFCASVRDRLEFRKQDLRQWAIEILLEGCAVILTRWLEGRVLSRDLAEAAFTEALFLYQALPSHSKNVATILMRRFGAASPSEVFWPIAAKLEKDKVANQPILNTLAEGYMRYMNSIGPFEVLSRYYQVRQPSVSASDKKWTEARVLCEGLLQKDIMDHDESSVRKSQKEALVFAFARIFGSEAAIALVREARPDLVGELTRGLEIDLQVGHLEDGEVEHK